jgi:hypothetical protein
MALSSYYRDKTVMASYFSDDNSRRETADKSSAPTTWLRFVGLISDDDLQKMAEAMEAGCEQVDPEEWNGSR